MGKTGDGTSILFWQLIRSFIYDTNYNINDEESNRHQRSDGMHGRPTQDTVDY